MNDGLISVPASESEIKAIECKFTVESRVGIVGDFERNIGGSQSQKRVTFEGYATNELYASLIDAIAKVVDDG